MRKGLAACAVALAALGARWAFVASARLPAAVDRHPEPRGVFHVHTTRSDGRGTVDDVALAAAAVGLDFVVLTDHNVAPLPAERRHGVLLIYGEEQSLPEGHLVTLAATGGELRLFAHPLNRRVPWRELSEPADGMELLSWDDFWREALRPPWGRLLLAFVDAPASMLYGVYDLFRRPVEALSAYDRLRPGRPGFRGLCSVDAHGLPGYATSFQSLQIHLPGLRLSGDAARDALAVADGLARGPLYCGLDGVASASGLGFAPVPGGTELRAPPVGFPADARVVTFCRGAVSAEGPLPVRVPRGCRAEIRLPELQSRWPASGGSWIYADPP